MLFKIKTRSEIAELEKIYPRAVTEELVRVTDILDSCYNRVGHDGGCILIAETVKDLQEAKNSYLDYETELPEIVKQINDYLSVLYLPATEYSVTLIIPVKIAPKEILSEVTVYE